MKITFEGTLTEIFDDMSGLMEVLLGSLKGEPVKSEPWDAARIKAVNEEVHALGTVQKAPPVDIPVQMPGTAPLKHKRERTEKQKINDEKMRVAALERVAAKRAAKAQQAAAVKVVEKALNTPVEKPVKKPVEEPQPFADPAEAVELRNKTIEELRAAFTNGHHQEVLALLSVHGNGAKSFRELPVEAFPAIRQAIDLGALEKEAPK